MEERSREATLLLVRHGETTWNVEGRVQGQQDAPLSERGKEQARLVAERLARATISAVYSSDLGRARATAEAVAAPHNLTPQFARALRERSFGVLEGKTMEEAGASQGLWFLTWQSDRLRNAPPDGEDQPAMCERVMKALRAIAGAHPGETVAVVTHGGPIKSAVYDILSIPLSLWSLTWISNGSITTIKGTPEVFQVACLNDTCHLGGMASRGEEMED